MRTYRTSEVAALIGIHPNTVRLYETLELIPKPARLPNGYRVFTEAHIAQFRLARVAFQIEVLQSGLRKKIITMIKAAAVGHFDEALALTHDYLEQLQQERLNAEKAITIVQDLLAGTQHDNTTALTRKQLSEQLHISMDTLRNWEMNGLLNVKRKKNGYRIYTDEDIQQITIIRSLRCANYSLEAILRMLHTLSADPNANIKAALNTPNPDDDIISVCDKLISSLQAAEANARTLIAMLHQMKRH